jgi:predicted nucleotidyltransferase
MYFSDDMRELVLLFKKHGVDFAICGGFAVAHYGFVRMTMDFDLLINPSADNAKKIMSALDEFGFGQVGISRDDFLKPGTAVTLGEQPNQIDLLTSMSSVPAGEILNRARTTRIGEIEVKVVSYKDLITAKQEADRPKDRIDLDELKRQNEDA